MVYIALFAVLVVMLLAIVVVTWKETKRAVREFLAPLKLKRFRSGLRGPLLVAALLAVLAKLVLWLGFFPNWGWLEIVGVLVVAAMPLVAAGFLVRSYLGTFNPRPKINQRAQVPANEEALNEITVKKPRKKRIRFFQKKRQTNAIKRMFSTDDT